MKRVLPAFAFSILLSASFGMAQAPSAAELEEAFPALKQRDPSNLEFIPDPGARAPVPNVPAAEQFNVAFNRLIEAESLAAVREITVKERRTAVEGAERVRKTLEIFLQDATKNRDRLQRQSNDGQPRAGMVDRMEHAIAHVSVLKARLDSADAELEKRRADLSAAETETAAARKARKDAQDEATASWTAHPGSAKHGVPIQRGTILVRFHETATKEQIEAVLDKYDLQIRAGKAKIRFFITETRASEIKTDPVVDAAWVRSRIELLKKEPSVASAVPNVLMGPVVLPIVLFATGEPPSSRTNCWDWYDKECLGISASRLVQFPSAWNFARTIQRNRTPPVDVLVLDEGFADHDDLDLKRVCTNATSDHGTHVVGIIGARFSNGFGIDGGTPFARILACAPKIAAGTTFGGVTLAFSEILMSLDEVLDEHHPRIVNVSLGYNWVLNFLVFPQENQYIQDIVGLQGYWVRALLKSHPETIVVSAAGNDCDDRLDCNDSAMWTSPFNWAALAPQQGSLPPSPNVLVVESVDKGGNPSVFSNVGGTIRAPGEHVFSTIGGNDYGLMDGTSMAAPEVTAVIALMLAYNPRLTLEEIRKHLQIGRPKQPPVINAFTAVASAQARSAADLADLTGDGWVDMDDFHVFKTHLQEIEAHDKDSTRRFSSDINRDDVIDFNEPVYPRSDLNGDGRLSRSDTSRFPGLGDVTDLQVMMHAWQDPKVPKEQLLRLLGR